MGDVRLQQFFTILIFLHCVIALVLQSLEQHETFALHSLEFLGKDLNMEH